MVGKVTKYEQLELWNDKPVPWRLRMEQDVFELAFPDEQRVEGDKVTVFMDYVEECEGDRWSSWTWDSASPSNLSNFVIEVRWEHPYEKVSQFNPVNKRGFGMNRRVVEYEKKEALKFWLDLMRKGSA